MSAKKILPPKITPAMLAELVALVPDGVMVDNGNGLEVWPSIGDSAEDEALMVLFTAGEAAQYVEYERAALPPKSRTKETTLQTRAARAMSAQIAEEDRTGSVVLPTVRAQREALKPTPSPIPESAPTPTMPGALVLLLATSTGVERSEVAA